MTPVFGPRTVPLPLGTRSQAASRLGCCGRRRQGSCRCFPPGQRGSARTPPAPHHPTCPAHLPLSDEGGQLLGPLVHQADMLDGVDQRLGIIWAGAGGRALESEPQGATPSHWLWSPAGTAEPTLPWAPKPGRSQARGRPCAHSVWPALQLTLVVVGDVVGGLRVDEQRWQTQRLVGLVPQADVVVPWRGRGPR